MGSIVLGASFEKQKVVFRKHDRQNEISHLLGDHAMRRFRFHLGTLVILILVLGIGFAALRESNETWDSGIFSITLGLLLISVLLAIHRTSRDGLSGWGSLCLSRRAWGCLWSRRLNPG